MKLLDWIIVFIMVLCLAYAVTWYNLNAINKCTSSPLTYGAKEMSDLYSADFEAMGWFIPDPIYSYHPKTKEVIEMYPLGYPKVFFNSTNIKIG